MTPNFLRITFGRHRFKPGPWNLGKWTYPSESGCGGGCEKGCLQRSWWWWARRRAPVWCSGALETETCAPPCGPAVNIIGTTWVCFATVIFSLPTEYPVNPNEKCETAWLLEK